ncbi:serine/threonine-protein kinase chk1 [Plakobranchus ocellatus]|uniref:Serine/threonine-protein kinase chk1 n=1 Tax=Plakobranchus ocellatus TaxID=259542 RepID=A0AAV3ZH72_9GAST|nr:serine/threonine-protein kinase chk1 [Plakobranchus ocellatus]
MELVQSRRHWAKFLKASGYQLVRCVGQGSFGDVYSVSCLETGQAWAVKRLVARRNIKEDNHAMAEIEALVSIKHPTIIGLKEILLYPRVACIVMELAPAGNLEVLVLNGWGSLEFSPAQKTLSDITSKKLNACGLCYRQQHLTSSCCGEKQSGFENNCIDGESIYIKPFVENQRKCEEESITFRNYEGGESFHALTLTHTSSIAVPPSPSPSISAHPCIDPSFLFLAFAQVTSALEFCHNLGLAHRDVNPSNVLVFHHDLVKLADFGLCFRCNNVTLTESADAELLCSDFLGRDQYLAPEVRRRKPFYAKPADVWSLGCVLFFMLKANHPPLDDNELVKTVTKRVSSLVPEGYDINLKEKCVRTLGKACQVEVSTRPTIRDIQVLWET